MKNIHARAGCCPARRRLKPLWFLALMFAAGGFLASGGKNEVEPWSVTVPASAHPGDCLVVRIESGSSLMDATVTLLGATGEIVSRTLPFDILPERAEDSTGPFGLVALVPLPSTLDGGAYSVEVSALQHGRPVNLVTPVTVEPKDFFSEEIPLNPANTAIKTDSSPLRLAQIKALNELLFAWNPAAPRFTGPFISPVGAARRSSRFGDRRVYRYASGKKDTAIHWGIDFGVPTGTPVFAAGDGTVIMAEKRISTGWTVVVEHLPGVYSLYYHLDALLAAKGETVRSGTLIARSGNTGLSTGAHLHWEFRVNGEPVSPDWFAGRTLY